MLYRETLKYENIEQYKIHLKMCIDLIDRSFIATSNPVTSLFASLIIPVGIDARTRKLGKHSTTEFQSLDFFLAFSLRQNFNKLPG